ncbi:hypothetical protein THAOC_31481, partial [Thalassiosira oceanica]
RRRPVPPVRRGVAGRRRRRPVRLDVPASADPPSRRTSTGDLGETDKRALIRDILRDPDLSQLEKRRTVQQLMDGRSQRRITIDCGRTNPYLDGRARKRPSQCGGDGGGAPTPEQRAELRELLGRGGGNRAARAAATAPLSAHNPPAPPRLSPS